MRRLPIRLPSFDGGAEEGKEKLSSAYWESVLAETEGRIDTINGWMEWDKFGHEWEGVWTDGYGGWLFILQNKRSASLLQGQILETA